MHAQLGLIQVMRVILKSGEASSFWAATAGRAAHTGGIGFGDLDWGLSSPC